MNTHSSDPADGKRRFPSVTSSRSHQPPTRSGLRGTPSPEDAKTFGPGNLECRIGTTIAQRHLGTAYCRIEIAPTRLKSWTCRRPNDHRHHAVTRARVTCARI